MWKSNISSMVEEYYTSKQVNSEFKLDIALKVCQAIYEYKKFLDYVPTKQKNDLKIADLVFQYLLVNGSTSVEAYRIILAINDRFYYLLPETTRPSKLIDIYKSNSIIDKIAEIKQDKIMNKIILPNNIEYFNKIDQSYYNFILWLKENSHYNEPKKISNVIYSFINLYGNELKMNDTNLFLLTIDDIVNVEHKIDDYEGISDRKKKTLKISLDLYKKFLQNLN